MIITTVKVGKTELVDQLLGKIRTKLVHVSIVDDGVNGQVVLLEDDAQVEVPNVAARIPADELRAALLPGALCSVDASIEFGQPDQSS
jgi:hypothetical protein